VIAVEPVKINEQGRPEVYTDALKQDPDDPIVTGVRIRFKQPQGKAQDLYYYSVNIADPSLAKKEPFQQYLRGLAPATSYLKSASYLLHKSYFGKIRDLILEVSRFVLEDDSGIPVRYFEEPAWSVTLYGKYMDPIPLFAKHKQLKLEELFKDRSRVKPLTFGIGYRWQAGTSNLIAATKK
jgi:hypothetical protein